jgi:hypothetical protein
MGATKQLFELGRAEGLQKGRAEGLRTAITALMAFRSQPLGEVGRARLDACTDVGALMHWHACLVASTRRPRSSSPYTR